MQVRREGAEERRRRRRRRRKRFSAIQSVSKVGAASSNDASRERERQKKIYQFPIVGVARVCQGHLLD